MPQQPPKLDIIGRAFLDALAIGETYDPTEYNELVGGSKFTSYEGFPDWPGRRFSTGMSHAAGRYQFEPATWAALQSRYGLSDFSPVNQDIAAWALALGDYRARTKRDLYADLVRKNFSYIVSGLRQTWTSVSVNTAQRYLGALAARRVIALSLNVSEAN